MCGLEWVILTCWIYFEIIKHQLRCSPLKCHGAPVIGCAFRANNIMIYHWHSSKYVSFNHYDFIHRLHWQKPKRKLHHDTKYDELDLNLVAKLTWESKITCDKVLMWYHHKSGLNAEMPSAAYISMQHKIVNMLVAQSHHNPQPQRSSSSGTVNMIPPWNIHTVKQSMPRSCSNGCSFNWFTPSEFFKFSQLTN